METCLADYLSHEKEAGYSASTLYRKGIYLRQFLEWCRDLGIESLLQITPIRMERYRKHLYYYRNEKGEALSFTTQARRLQEVRKFFQHLIKRGVLPQNPAEGTELPRQSEHLPLTLTKRELERILAAPDTTDPLGLRDRAILEILYATGLTREELWGLEVDHISLEEPSLKVDKEPRKRKIPLLPRTAHWLKRYLEEARPGLLNSPEEKALFLGKKKRPFVCRDLSVLVRKYKKRAGIEKRGSFTLFRHSLIALLLEGGMDLRYIQEIMGLGKLEQIQRYSGVSIGKLKEVHAKTHPSAGRKSKK